MVAYSPFSDKDFIKVDLVFGDVGWRFPVFIGCLKAVEERGFIIRKIWASGSSTIPATLWATGLSADQIEDYLFENKELRNPCPYSFWNLFRSENKIKENNDNTLSTTLRDIFEVKNFKHTDNKLSVFLTDLEQRVTVELSSEIVYFLPLWKAVKASSSLLHIFSPLVEQGKFVGYGPGTQVLPLLRALDDYLLTSRFICLFSTFNRSKRTKNSDVEFLLHKLTYDQVYDELSQLLERKTSGAREKVIMIRDEDKNRSYYDLNLNDDEWNRLVSKGYKLTQNTLNIDADDRVFF